MAIKKVRPRKYLRRPEDMPSFGKYDYLDCRIGLRHAWESDGTVVLSTRPMEWIQYAHCMRCGTTREVVITSAGHVESTHYSYPEGYKLPKLTKGDRRRMRVAHVKKDMARGGRQLRSVK